jgi:hypothetical protein
MPERKPTNCDPAGVRDVCWECRDGYKKEGACKNTYIYEEARNVLVKELMAEVLGQRPGVVKK